MKASANARAGWLLILTHLAGWLPLANLVRDFLVNGLPINPIQDWTFGTGLPALVFLILTLAVTPVITVTGWSQLNPIRRWLGLYAFFYAVLHMSLFFVVDYGLDLVLITNGIIEKRYVLAGLGAFLIMLPLALTSTRGWQKRLGKRWKLLHRGAYVAAGLAILHFVWLVKADIREPLLYGAAAAALLLARLPVVRRKLAALRQGATARQRSRTHAGTPPVAEPGHPPPPERTHI